ncbi:MAG: NAD-dependent epimerase/dehydratase family protein, partial [Bdellovibrionales bacterium]|nr:NAD-dependent epimerase/dehydratase family protein [Bdellovibrionales bacterium]
MRALVTGGTGFLGQWLLKRLVSENHEVRALVRRPNESIPTSVQQFVGDVTDSNSLTPAMKSVDVVYHLAGVVGYSRAQRKTMEDVNVGGTRNVIESVISSGRPQLVHMSSVVAIGASFKPVPLNESAEYNLSHLNLGYFETKRKAEELVKEATQSQKIRSVILNPSTIWGAGDFEKGSRKIQLLVAKGKFAVYPPGGLNIVNVESV